MKTEVAMIGAALIVAGAIIFANHKRMEFDNLSYSRCMGRATPIRMENFKVGADQVLTDQEILDSIQASQLCIANPAVRH